MPQVKIKQGTKSSINNNAGVLNAGTLAITTDSNELFVTHNDGTVHQLCDNVNKSGDTMTGNLNMSGNSFENAGFEVVTSLPTTNNFVGRQVTYQGRSYIWNGSAWRCNSAISNTIAFTTLENTKFINHNLGYYPNIQVVDSNGNIVQVDKQHIDMNNIYLSWAGGINGNIILN